MLDESIISADNFSTLTATVTDSSVRIGLSNRQVPVLAGDREPFGIATQ